MWIDLDIRRGPAQGNSPGFKDIGAIGNGQRGARILLDQQNGQPTMLKIDDGLENPVNHAALISSTYICSVFRSGSPKNDAGPVTDKTAPIFDLCRRTDCAGDHHRQAARRYAQGTAKPDDHSRLPGFV
jgi:hypothetical protein